MMNDTAPDGHAIMSRLVFCAFSLAFCGVLYRLVWSGHVRSFSFPASGFGRYGMVCILEGLALHHGSFVYDTDRILLELCISGIYFDGGERAYRLEFGPSRVHSEAKRAHSVLVLLELEL